MCLRFMEVCPCGSFPFPEAVPAVAVKGRGRPFSRRSRSSSKLSYRNKNVESEGDALFEVVGAGFHFRFADRYSKHESNQDCGPCSIGSSNSRACAIPPPKCGSKNGSIGTRSNSRITPSTATTEFFPDPYDGSEESERALLDTVCGYMDVVPDIADLNLSSIP